MRSVSGFKPLTVKDRDSWQNHAMKISTSPDVPLSLYIHIPWCERKCPYCDFNSHDNQQHFDEKRYVQALLDDLDQDLNPADERKMQSIFIGGGTPSLFSGEAYQTLLSEIGARIDISNAEITLEANPGSSERNKFTAYREAGINRLSIGTQSYDDILLKKIGRVHGREDALGAASAARDAGFDNFNLDIMFALPEQSLEQAIDDIETAIAQAPTHLSCYQLTLEPNTLFYKNPPKLPSSDRAWEIQLSLQEILKKAGFMQYEVSAYAQADRQCRHNLNYWQYGDYLGIGAGAHGKITTADGSIYRYWKQKQPKKYIDSSNSITRLGNNEKIEKSALTFEFMLNALRLKNGFSEGLFAQRTGLPINALLPNIDQHLQQGLLERADGTIRPTDDGYRFIDSMLNDYL